MELNERYADIIKRYPEYITQNQMIEICGVCAKTAYNLERRGVIPYTVEVNPTRRIHRIKLLDVIAYLHQKGKTCENRKVIILIRIILILVRLIYQSIQRSRHRWM